MNAAESTTGKAYDVGVPNIERVQFKADGLVRDAGDALREAGLAARRRWGNLEYWMQVELALRLRGRGGREIRDDELPYLTAKPSSGKVRTDGQHWKLADLVVVDPDDVLVLELKQIPVRPQQLLDDAHRRAGRNARGMGHWHHAAHEARRDLHALEALRIDGTLDALGPGRLAAVGGDVGWVRLERVLEWWPEALRDRRVFVGVLALVTWEGDAEPDRTALPARQDLERKISGPDAGTSRATAWYDTEETWRLWAALSLLAPRR